MNILLTLGIFAIVARVGKGRGGEETNGTVKSSVQSVLSATTHPPILGVSLNLEEDYGGGSTNGTEETRHDSPENTVPTKAYDSSATLTSIPSTLTATGSSVLDYTTQVLNTASECQYRGK